MLKLKLMVFAAALGIAFIAIGNTQSYVPQAANNDVAEKIADYKSWTKITEKPIEIVGNFAPMG